MMTHGTNDDSEVQALISIRPAREDDLTPLEWYGLNAPFRVLIRRAWERAIAGEVAYLVADIGSFPAGQVLIDFGKDPDGKVATIWALRVLPALQCLGIGARLMGSAESLSYNRGFRTAELRVGRENGTALRLYERLGYATAGQDRDSWSATTAEGEVVLVVEDVWVMRKTLLPGPG